MTNSGIFPECSTPPDEIVESSESSTESGYTSEESWSEYWDSEQSWSSESTWTSSRNTSEDESRTSRYFLLIF
jgi:hypothetical protein